MKNDLTKIFLKDTEIPKFWYNIQADMPHVPPMHINSQTMKVATVDEMNVLFPKELLAQEYSNERYIEIPKEVLEFYKTYRSTPLIRAKGLEKTLKTTAKIYYKYEGQNASGSHKLNSAIAQAYYNKLEGIKRITTETGAGQWGTAISIACQKYGMECIVYMVRISFEQKPYRKILMNTFGANVIASPSNLTNCGKAYYDKDKNHSGSLGIAISEAVEDAATHDDTHYSLGSVLNHVCMHQTIIGQEAKLQMEMFGDYPDVVIGCVGGGSSFSGLAFPFMQDKLNGKKIDFIGIEPSACPTLTKGVYAYDYGDSAKIGPITKMYTLGHDFIPSGIHAGGLRYHGMSPIISSLYNDKLMAAKAYNQSDCLKAGVTFARAEGIVPAPESSHAIMGVIDEANKAAKEGKEKVILFNLTGHGYLDLYAYEKYLSNQLTDTEYSESEVKKSMQNLPKID